MLSRFGADTAENGFGKVTETGAILKGLDGISTVHRSAASCSCASTEEDLARFVIAETSRNKEQPIWRLCAFGQLNILVINGVFFEGPVLGCTYENIQAV